MCPILELTLLMWKNIKKPWENVHKNFTENIDKIPKTFLGITIKF